MYSQKKTEIFWAIVFILPAVLGFLMWNIIPIISSAVISFTEFRLLGKSIWVGWDNYRYLFVEDFLFPKVIKVTLYYSLVSVPLKLLFALLIAILLNKKIKGLAIFRTIFYLPAIVPLIAATILWVWIFNPDFGLLNVFLKNFGVGKIQWIYSSNWVIPSLILMSLWDVGPLMIIFLAGLQGVPRTLYEAADIDGASKFRKFYHVTLPMITPTLLFNLVITIITTLQTFLQPYVMTEGGPNNESLLYLLYLYRTAFKDYEMGLASAQAWLIFIFIALLSYIVFRTSKYWVYYEGK
ncbi:MAG: carbohydrate ABC transporter permease [bacterium]